MKHLKLGAYSFTIDINELELVSGTEKKFTRGELPYDLKPLFDIVKSHKLNQKSIFVNILVNEYYSASGYLTQYANDGYSLESSDGSILIIRDSDETKITIVYTEY